MSAHKVCSSDAHGWFISFKSNCNDINIILFNVEGKMLLDLDKAGIDLKAPFSSGVAPARLSGVGMNCEGYIYNIYTASLDEIVARYGTLGDTTGVAQVQDLVRQRLEYTDFYMDMGGKALSAGKLEEAASHFSQIIRVNSGYAPALYGMGVVAMQTGQYAEAAMCFAGSWLENEMKDFMPENFNMVMMETPVVDDAYLEILGLDGITVDQDKVINNANAGDVMFIPAKATNKELAKEFLAFLCSEEMLIEFTEFTGMMRPFEYNPLTSTYKDPAKEYSEFTQSCFNLYMNCDANLFEFPKNASLKQQQDPTFNTYIYTYKRPEIFQEVTLTTAITKLKTLTGEEVMVTGGPNYESVYTRVSKEFPKWESELGLA